MVHIIKLRENAGLIQEAAEWFHQKWGIPLEAYAESMDMCIRNKKEIPQWYLAMVEGRIVGGLGVIENDFHDRKDLTPNVCAVYVEEEYRCRGIAGKQKEWIPFILSRIILRFTNVTDGNFCVWFRGMVNRRRQECMSIGKHPSDNEDNIQKKVRKNGEFAG